MKGDCAPPALCALLGRALEPARLAGRAQLGVLDVGPASPGRTETGLGAPHCAAHLSRPIVIFEPDSSI